MVEYRKKLMSSLFKLSKVQCPPLIMYQRLSPTPFKKATTVAYLFLPTTIVIYISALILRCQFPTKQSFPCPTHKKKKKKKKNEEEEEKIKQSLYQCTTSLQV